MGRGETKLQNQILDKNVSFVKSLVGRSEEHALGSKREN